MLRYRYIQLCDHILWVCAFPQETWSSIRYYHMWFYCLIGFFRSDIYERIISQSAINVENSRKRTWLSKASIKLSSGPASMVIKYRLRPYIRVDKVVNTLDLCPPIYSVAQVCVFVLFYSLTYKHSYRFWTSCCISWPLYKRGGGRSVTSPNVLWLRYTPEPLVHRYYLVALARKEASHGNPHSVVWWFFFFYGFLGAFTHSTFELFPLHLTTYICHSSQTRRVSKMELMVARTQTLSQRI